MMLFLPLVGTTMVLAAASTAAPTIAHFSDLNDLLKLQNQTNAKGAEGSAGNAVNNQSQIADLQKKMAELNLEIAKTSDLNKKTALEIQLNYTKTAIQILQATEDASNRMNDAVNR
jgi:hypothetical protein